MSIEIQILNTAAVSAVCIGKIMLISSKHILTTQDELALLRQCAEYIKTHPSRTLKIIDDHTNKIAFIRKTLIHLGVSCGQIIVRAKP